VDQRKEPSGAPVVSTNTNLENIMFRTAAVLAVLAVSFLPASAMACGMYIPSDDVNLAELLGEIDGAVEENTIEEMAVAEVEAVQVVEAAEVVQAAPVEVEPTVEVGVKKGLFRKARPSS
jgi:hypothetical protein